jgi:predicted dehydrogenase
MTKQLTAGILGAGQMGRRHGTNLMKLGAQVVAVCDRDPARAAELAAALSPETRSFDDFARMLDAVEMDILYLCLPPFAHEGQLEAAAAKGIHLFVEKPIAIDTRQAAKMVEAVRKAGVISQVGYHMRFNETVARLKALVDSGATGRPTLFDGRYACNSLHGKPWWMDKEKSGGQVFEQVIHIYDMAMHLLGNPATAVGFLDDLCHREIPGYTVEDTSVSAIRFQSGALASIAASNCAVPGEWNSSFTVVFEKLTAHFQGDDCAEFIHTGETPPRREILETRGDPHFAETVAFLQAVRGGTPSPCPISEGFRSLQLVEAVVRSSEEGRFITLG